MNARLLLLVLALVIPFARAADPAVEVKFGDLSKFSDLRNSTLATPSERESLAGVLRRHLEAEAPERIPASTRLLVTITDVDMAGEFRLHGSARDIRVIKDMYPPRIALDFKLVRADGGVEREGHRDLRGSAFLWGSSPVSSESMRFERELLDEWLRKEFAPPKRASAKP